MKHFFYFFFVVIIFLLLSTLGFWQLHRAHEKEVLLLQAAQFNNSAPIAFTAWLSSPQDYQKVNITGFFVPNKNVFIDKINAKGQVGFEVLSLFDAQDQWLLIDRGFIEGSRAQRQLPFLPPIEGTVTLMGKMKPFE